MASRCVTAITREVPASLRDCLLTHIERRQIDVGLARQQHAGYQDALRAMGAEVLTLPALDDLPDSVFVEDAAVVTAELAIIGRAGAPERRAENAVIADVLAPLRPLVFIEEPGTIDGGDVLQLGRHVLVGASARTNHAAIVQLAVLLEPHGYNVIPVPVQHCLHLKSAVTALSEDTVLYNPEWVDEELLPAQRRIRVAPAEPFAANVLVIEGQVLASDAFPETRDNVERAGFRTHTIDVSELQKAEGALTCCSILVS